MNNKLYTIITNIIQKNSNNYTDNKLFGLLSILAISEITEIYKSNININSNNQTQDDTPSLKNIANSGNIANLLGQLQGASNNNIQQLLPLLMGMLGGGGNNNGNNGNGNIDISKINKKMMKILIKQTHIKNKTRIIKKKFRESN